MREDVVIFEGEFHTVIDEAIAQVEDEDNELILLTVICIERIEAGLEVGGHKAFWTPLDGVKTLPSNIRWQNTDWSQGVRNGRRQMDKDNLG